VLRAGPPLAAAGILAAVLSGGGAAATATTASVPSYAALAGTEPTGLQLVDSPAAGPSAGPTWPETTPEGAAGRWPVAASIRRVKLAAPGLSAWIARSGEGGICVLLYDGAAVGGVSAVYMGCSTPEGLARGATVEASEIPGMPGEFIAAGVVPDGVTAVSRTMADGSTETTPVSGNAWAQVGDVGAAPDQQTTEITGG
jgi:hypothetical protein